MPYSACLASRLLVISGFVCLHLLPLTCSGQTHLTRSVSSGGGISIVTSTGSGSPSDLMTPSYHRRQDEYSIAVNCTPGLSQSATAAYSVEQPPPSIAISATATGGVAMSSRLSWLVRPSETYDFSTAYTTLVAFDMDANCHAAAPASASAASASLIRLGNYCALVSARQCSLVQIVLAVRRHSPLVRLFLLRDMNERAMIPPLIGSADEATLQIAPGLIVFAYVGQAGSAARLAEEIRNRTCSIVLHYRLSVLDNLINKTSVLFVSVSFILLMIISLSWLVFYYVQRFRYLHAKERLSRRLGNAAKKALTMIPVRILKPGDKDFTWIGDQCAVCIEPYRVSDTVRILPCRHFYHRSCIDPWLLDQRTCPLCKLDILKAVGLALRDRRQRRRHGSVLDGRSPTVAAAHGGSAAAAAAVVEEGADDYYSMADSVGVISSSGGGGGIIIGCLGGGSARPSSTAASSSDSGSASGVVMVTRGSAFGAERADDVAEGIMLMPLQSIPTRPESPAIDESAEVCYPLVHHYHQHPLAEPADRGGASIDATAQHPSRARLLL